jgi:hypothetical protein
MLSSICFAQKRNYALNGSFENITDCPNREGQIENAKYFDRWGSVDLFSVCGIDGLGIPDNSLGEQFSADGNSMAGMIVTTQGWSYYEYLVGRLDSGNMVDGQEYCLSMKVSLAEESPYSVDQMAFFFSGYRRPETFYNQNGAYRFTIYPWRNFNDYYNGISNSSYKRGSNSYLTTLGLDADMRDKKSWVTIKNSIIYQKEHDVYFWIGGNSLKIPNVTLENDNQYIFNPDRTVYYYLDDIQVTKQINDTILLNPVLSVDCEKYEYKVTLPVNHDNVVCYQDSQEIDVFIGNVATFRQDTKFENVSILCSNRDNCDEVLYKLNNPTNFGETSFFRFFPNPASKNVQFNLFGNGDSDKFEVLIYDSQGKVIKHNSRKLASGPNFIIYDVSDLSTAVYMFQVITNECSFTEKIVIKSQ